MPRCAAAWGASCTPSPCRPRCRADPGAVPGPTARHAPPPIAGRMTAMTNPVFERIESDIKANPVVLYMKGTPVFPQCGFSARVVQILSHLGVPFKGVNVLEDAEIREGIKAYTNWPTIPQLYVGGEFVGGCDIIMEMFQAGELSSLMKDKGIPVSAEA